MPSQNLKHLMGWLQLGSEYIGCARACRLETGACNLTLSRQPGFLFQG
jgi:hypothetical protein